MLVLPAIDLRGGQAVRLRQGDYNQETVFDADPAAVARRWADQGARYLHLVDLDGAKAGKPVNGKIVQRIVTALDGIPCQLGGGVRTEEDLNEVLSWGVERVIIGSRALKDPDWLRGMAEKHPGKIILGIDARDGKVATDGWLNVSAVSAFDLARMGNDMPLAAVVYTDISKDGMMAGPNLEGLAEMASAARLPVIASGGVTTLEDVRALARMGLYGCIIGRALYEGSLMLSSVLAVVESERGSRMASPPGRSV